jgi:hypothetical protein
MTEAAPAIVQVARFNSLSETHVVEHWKFSIEELLSWLEQKPTQGWRGQHKHPGWSPVLYDPPERLKENIKQVFALVLDYDKGATWDAVSLLWAEFYGTIYTTKSHDIGKHRLRVVLPLSRPVSVDEYGKLWLWADQQANRVDLKTDGQAKDASRFWYTPTAPDKGEWRAERLCGAMLDVDATLPLVDSPQLRVVRPTPVVTTDAKVKRAAKYLARITPAVAGDYGHTQTFNAVAHVMFGFDLDIETTYDLIASEYNPRCDPPWAEKDLRHKVESCAKDCKRSRGYLLDSSRHPVHTTAQAAHKAPDVPDELDVDWRAMLLRNEKQKARRGYHNVLVVIRHHPNYRGKWSLNTMTNDVWFAGAPMPDTFVHDLRAFMDENLGFTPSRDDVEAAIKTSAKDRPFHPIQQYLRSIDWDGTERLHAMARDYLGSQSELHAQLVRKWMISAVARALNPGCKVDTALMLHGEQGLYKSSFFTILGGTWHADSPIDIANKDSFAQIHASWIYEFAELENVVTGRAESRLKAWLTSTHDMYRAPYERTVARRPRSCVICGTTNRKQFLTDDTGSRRFWIVGVAQEIPRQLLEQMRDQLWAEAVCAYDAGETWWLDRELEAEREEVNADYADDDPWQEPIEQFLASPLITETTIATVLRDALKVDASRQDRWAQMRAARILHLLGWERRRVGKDRRYAYRRSL